MVFDLINNASVLLTAASGNGDVYEYSPTGSQSIFAAVVDPVGIAVNSSSDVFVGLGAVAGGSKIEEFAPNGSVINANFGTNVVAQSLAVNSAGDVFAADNKSGNVYEYGPSGGTPTKIATLSSTTDNYFGMALDAAGDLYISYQNSAVGSTSGGIYELTPNGSGYSLSTFFTAATFLPTAIAIDPGSGNLYLSYVNSLSSPGGGVDVFNNTGGTLTSVPITDLIDSNGYPGGLAVLTPEPGSLFLLVGGLLAIFLFRSRVIAAT